jgi:hypothetical protein
VRRPADPPFPVDLAGVDREWVEPVSGGRRWLGGVMVLLGVVQLSLQWGRDDDRWLLVVWTLYTVLAVGTLAGALQTRVRLEERGFRRGDPLWRGRLRPWSRVRDVQPAGPWTEHPQLLGSRASDRPVPLAGMDAEQAERLRVRLVEGRARAERRVTR